MGSSNGWRVLSTPLSLTLERTLDKIKDLEDRIARFKAYQRENPDIDLASIAPDDMDDEDMRDALEVGKKLTFRMAHLRLDDWLKALHEDRRQLHSIYIQAKDVDHKRDAKLAELKRIIREKMNRPTCRKDGRLNRKLLVFTAFADTATYIYDSLIDWVRQDLRIHAALVTGSGQNKTTLGIHGVQPDFDELLARVQAA